MLAKQLIPMKFIISGTKPSIAPKRWQAARGATFFPCYYHSTEDLWKEKKGNAERLHTGQICTESLTPVSAP